MSVNKINPEVDSNQKNTVSTTIIDYNKKGLVKNKSELFWRILGQIQWKSIALIPIKVKISMTNKILITNLIINHCRKSKQKYLMYKRFKHDRDTEKRSNITSYASI